MEDMFGLMRVKQGISYIVYSKKYIPWKIVERRKNPNYFKKELGIILKGESIIKERVIKLHYHSRRSE